MSAQVLVRFTEDLMNPISQLQPATFAEFEQATARGNIVAVTRTIAAETISPVDAFVNVANGARYAFLFESVEGRTSVGNYSFLGADPYMIVGGRGQETTVEKNGVIETLPVCLTEFLRGHFSENKLANGAEAGPLAGGAVGYLGYGAANWFEPALNRIAEYPGESSPGLRADDALLMF